jgi:hypothetical protein
MNKIYLNQYLTIVLSAIFLILFANNSYLTYLLFSLTSQSPEVFADTGFQIKFFETVFFAVIYLSTALYFAFMAIMKFSIIEFGKDSKSKKDSEE